MDKLVEAANDRCACAEVMGENPLCSLHGVETKWALMNTAPEDWQEQVLTHMAGQSLSADRIESQAAEIEALKHDLARSMETANAYLNERESLTRRVAALFDAIQHGDDEHREWLRQAIGAHFAGEPVPEPRGKGRKEARIAELERALRPFAEAHRFIADDYDDDYAPDWSPFLPVKHYRRARATLQGDGE